MRHDLLMQLRKEFSSAIAFGDGELDLAIASLQAKIGTSEFLEHFSVYSHGHLRSIGTHLRDINAARLRNDPLRVALAVDAVMTLLDRLATTVEQSVESDRRIEANRSSYRSNRTSGISR
jgi:hypothetical protein